MGDFVDQVREMEAEFKQLLAELDWRVHVGQDVDTDEWVGYVEHGGRLYPEHGIVGPNEWQVRHWITWSIEPTSKLEDLEALPYPDDLDRDDPELEPCVASRASTPMDEYEKRQQEARDDYLGAYEAEKIAWLMERGRQTGMTPQQLWEEMKLRTVKVDVFAAVHNIHFPDVLPGAAEDCCVVWNSKLGEQNVLGRFQSSQRRIELDPSLQEDKAELIETFLHEIAHAATYLEGEHGLSWRAYARLVGCRDLTGSRDTKPPLLRTDLDPEEEPS